MLAPAILQRTNRAEGAQKRLLALSCEESRSVGASSVAHRIRPFCFRMVGSIAVATFGFVLRLFVQPVRAFLGRSLADAVTYLQPSNAGSDRCASKREHSSTSFVDAFNAVHSIDAALFTLKSSRQLFLVRLGFLFALKLQAVVGRTVAGYLKRKLLAGILPCRCFPSSNAGKAVGLELKLVACILSAIRSRPDLTGTLSRLLLSQLFFVPIRTFTGPHSPKVLKRGMRSAELFGELRE